MPHASPPALTVRDLVKTYGDHAVLTGLELSVPSGGVFALLGPNGAGKTTLVRILATLGHADSGEIRVLGHDPARDAATIRRRIGLTGQFSAVDDVLTGAENLRLTARLLHLDRDTAADRTADLLARFDLTEIADRRAGTYSGGLRRRLDLAMSLMGDPDLLFLDEPTTGLDPRSRRELWQAIRHLTADGVTVFLTTQYLEEADQLADRIALLDHGTIVAEGTAEELKRRAPGGHILLRFGDPHQLAAALRAVGDCSGTTDPDQLTLTVPSDGNAGDVKRLLDLFEREDVTVERLTVHIPDLDDVFFALTGHPTRPAAVA